MKRSATRRNGAWKIFRMPLLLAGVSIFGLLAALLVDGPLDLLWTLAVSAPLAAIVIHIARST
jgi:hypothetical protein